MRTAFFDPSSRVLKCHGFVKTNEIGDIAIEVPDDFDKAPGEWRLAPDGLSFEPVSKLNLTAEQLAVQWMTQPGVISLIEAITEIHEVKARAVIPADRQDIINRATAKMAAKL